ncbi:MAG: helix-turn-helix transcriptional regulator [Thaumarchaeota archaeon]|nr:helix-turn-helix transcriptional regulator [Nitrososphaerota archaeon]
MLEVRDETNKEIQDLLSDNTNRMILQSIITTPKSTSQLCIECNIPTSTAYRKMQKLSEHKMIRKIGTINESGKREILYKSNFFVLKNALK